MEGDCKIENDCVHNEEKEVNIPASCKVQLLSDARLRASNLPLDACCDTVMFGERQILSLENFPVYSSAGESFTWNTTGYRSTHSWEICLETISGFEEPELAQVDCNKHFKSIHL